tara:strand:- start:931 stop:1890 length:960 start_codon:yes stop_codon:yes gene_type:complete
MIIYSHASPHDAHNIQKFISENWKENHILSKNNKVFDHFYLQHKTLQFFIAKNNNEIVGILGYMTSKQFDSSIYLNAIWLALWATKKSLREPVGINLIKYLEDYFQHADLIACLGVATPVIPIYERMGYKSGQMEHLKKEISDSNNSSNDEYKISSAQLRDIDKNSIIYKTTESIRNKYLSQNFYDYDIFSLTLNNLPITSIIGRVLHDNTSDINIFRIIDFCGDIDGLSLLANKLSNSNFIKNINFIDILISESEIFIGSDFTSCTQDNFLPLYFEPLVEEYKIKNYVYKILSKSFKEDLIIISGDGDQERPNSIKNH